METPKDDVKGSNFVLDVHREMSIDKDKRMEVFEVVREWLDAFPEKHPKFSARIEPTQKPDLFDIIFRWNDVMALRMACLLIKEEGYPVMVEGGDVPKERAADKEELEKRLLNLCKCVAFRTRYTAMIQLLKAQPDIK